MRNPTETHLWARRGSISDSHFQPGIGWPLSTHSITTNCGLPAIAESRRFVVNGGLTGFGGGGLFCLRPIAHGAGYRFDLGQAGTAIFLEIGLGWQNHRLVLTNPAVLRSTGSQRSLATANSTKRLGTCSRLFDLNLRSMNAR